MNDILDEIGEDLRSQQLRAFWRENGPWIIGGVLLAIVATAGISFWKSWKEKVNTRETTALMQVLEQADIEKLDSYAKDAKASHRSIARLMEAGLYIQRNDTKKAIESFDALARDSRTDKIWRDLAHVQSLSLRLDEGDSKKLMAEIEDLANDKKSPWVNSALELKALLHAREQDYAKAVQTFEEIAASKTAPEGLKSRATSLRDFYNSKVKH